MSSASFLPGFENDIFISYTHIDNRPFGETHTEWVTRVPELLATRADQLPGQSVVLWRASKLHGSDECGAELLERLKTTALFVPVFSPRYFRSEWCQRELRAFLESAARTGGVRLENKLRILKVLRTPVAPEDIPPDLAWLMEGSLGYAFYRQLENGRIRDYSIDPALREEYWLQLDDLAQDIAKMLSALARRGLAVPNPESGGKVVYLAETTSDMEEARDRIRRELAMRGHRVLPEKRLPLRAQELRQEVLSSVEAADLSIHPVGGVYGVIPEGSEESLVALQLRAASMTSANGDFSRVVWMPRGLEPEENRQRLFIQEIRTSPSVGKGLEPFVGTLEELKTHVEDLLAPKRHPEP